MRRLLFLSLLFLALLPAASGRAAALPTLGVRQALALCQANPHAVERVQVHGWFVPAIDAYRYTEGGLFPNRRAVPPGGAQEWDIRGRWRRHGALYVHITTMSSFGLLWLTLHGSLSCATLRLVTDRDPFPPPVLHPVYAISSAGSGTPSTTTATANGVTLSLIIPRRAYPRNALVRVRVTLTNSANHDIAYRFPGVSPPGVVAPQAEVLNSSGRVVFPPAMPFMPPLPGPAPAPVPLHPHQSISQNEYIILAGARVRAAQPIWLRPPARIALPPVTLATRPVTVTLTSEPAPVLHLTGSGSALALDITRPSYARGSPLGIVYADCGFPNAYTYNPVWTPLSTHLTPGCGPVKEWHVRIGWLNYPVAAFDYGSNGTS